MRKIVRKVRHDAVVDRPRLCAVCWRSARGFQFWPKDDRRRFDACSMAHLHAIVIRHKRGTTMRPTTQESAALVAAAKAAGAEIEKRGLKESFRGMQTADFVAVLAAAIRGFCESMATIEGEKNA